MMKNQINTCLTASLLIFTVEKTQANDFKLINSPVKYSFLSIPNSEAQNHLPAKLSIPSNVSKPPVIIIAHGSGGVDERGKLYSKYLTSNGFATLEIDMWSARGLNGGLSRPKHVNETIPDILASIDYLKENKNINSNKIGLIGFSWGGVLSMLLSDSSYNAPSELKAMVANYPVCWAYNKVPGYNFNNLRENINTLIISGKKDFYDAPDDCHNLIKSIDKTDQTKVKLLELNNATHGFDNKVASSTFYDPYAYQGKGGEVPISFNSTATKKSLEEVISFFKTKL